MKMKLYALYHESGSVTNKIVNNDEALVLDGVKSHELLHEWDDAQPPRNKFESYFYRGE